MAFTICMLRRLLIQVVGIYQQLYCIRARMVRRIRARQPLMARAAARRPISTA